MVRAGENCFLFEEFQQKSIIAIGWNELGKLESSITIDLIKKEDRAIIS